MSEFNEVGEILQRVAQDLDFSLWGLNSCPCLEKQTFSAVNESCPPAQNSLLPSLPDYFVLCWPVPDNAHICSWTCKPLGHLQPLKSWQWQTSAYTRSRLSFFLRQNNIRSYLRLFLVKKNLQPCGVHWRVACCCIVDHCSSCSQWKAVLPVVFWTKCARQWFCHSLRALLKHHWNYLALVHFSAETHLYTPYYTVFSSRTEVLHADHPSLLLMPLRASTPKGTVSAQRTL